MTLQATSPQYERKDFRCPHCGVYAYQIWEDLLPPMAPANAMKRAFCQHCTEYTIWNDGRLVYPAGLIGPPPADEMNDEVQEVYEEARAVARASPRAAAALLRVCAEMVVNELVPRSDSLNTKTRKLVERSGVVIVTTPPAYRPSPHNGHPGPSTRHASPIRRSYRHRARGCGRRYGPC